MFQPDSVLHTAFRQNDPGLWDVTAGGALHVARAAAQSGARLIHLSSDVIFSGERDGAYTESDPPDPITAYGTAKADAERLVLEECPNAVVVRTSLIYGFHPIDRHTRFVLDVADGTQDAQLFTDEYRCPILVDDLAVALLELVSHSYEGIINVAGIERLSRYEFGTLLAQAHGRDPSRIGQGLSSESGLRRPRNCTLDVSLAQALLPTPLRGVREVLAAYAAGTL
jgi:dTDP-4-dehydrorhamnose reductase